MKAVKVTCAGQGGGARARSSATLGRSHRLSLLPYFFNYRIFSYKEKNTWWAWQVAHSTGIGWYSVCMSSVRWTAGLPLHSDELAKIKFSAHHLPNWLMGLQKKQAAAYGRWRNACLSSQLLGVLQRNSHSQSHFRDLTRT